MKFCFSSSFIIAFVFIREAIFFDNYFLNILRNICTSKYYIARTFEYATMNRFHTYKSRFLIFLFLRMKKIYLELKFNNQTYPNWRNYI